MSIKCLVKKKIIELLHVVQARAEGPKAPSPGHRPGYQEVVPLRPVRAKALNICSFITNFIGICKKLSDFLANPNSFSYFCNRLAVDGWR